MALGEKLNLAFDLVRAKQSFEDGDPDEKIAEKTMEIIKSLLLTMLPIVVNRDNVDLQPVDIDNSAEKTTLLQVSTTKEFLNHFSSKEVNFGLAVISLAIALEEEFRAKLLRPLGDACKSGRIRPLDLSSLVCRKNENSYPDQTCERYREFLKGGSERVLFGDLTATWQILTKERKQVPPLLDEITTWFAERMNGSPLLDSAASKAIEELGRLRNQAAHPGKPPVDEISARKAYTICIERLGEALPVGLISEMAKLGNSG